MFTMHIISMGLTCMWVYVETYFESSICGRASLRKLRKSLAEDVRMGSKYASGITFTGEKVYRMSIFVLYSQRQLCQSHWKICYWSSCL